MNKTISMRFNFLKQFRDYVFNEIGDEDIIEYWLMYGIPDGADDDELINIASDEDDWYNMVNAFAKCCKMAGVM